MSEDSPRYFAYMLRVWQASAGGSLSWRATLESPHTGERLGFPDMKSLFAFLDEKTSSPEKTKPVAKSRLAASKTARASHSTVDPTDADPIQKPLVEVEVRGTATDGNPSPRPEQE